MTYVPLEPLPGIDQTGKLNFGTFLEQIFKILIALGALITVGAFIYAGIAYMSSETLGKINDAKARLRAAFFGLLLLLGAWVILYTINPQLVTFSAGISQGGVAIPLSQPPAIQQGCVGYDCVTAEQRAIIQQVETDRGRAGADNVRTANEVERQQMEACTARGGDVLAPNWSSTNNWRSAGYRSVPTLIAGPAGYRCGVR